MANMTTWRTGRREKREARRAAREADKAARALKFTGKDLLSFGVIDEVIPEPLGGAHRDHRQTAATLKNAIVKQLRSLSTLSTETLLERRYQKFRKIGQFLEAPVAAEEAPKATATV